MLQIHPERGFTDELRPTGCFILAETLVLNSLGFQLFRVSAGGGIMYQLSDRMKHPLGRNSSVDMTLCVNSALHNG